MKKPSFLERLTGAGNDDYDRVLNEDHSFGDDDIELGQEYQDSDEADEWEADSPAYAADEPQEGELPVDMYQTDDAIVIRSLVAGVKPSDLDIAITRDMVTIRGIREEMQEAHDSNYYHRELFWGSFSRTIVLPEEVIIDEADAQEKHGLLEIRLPKLDKNRSTQLRVRSHAAQK